MDEPDTFQDVRIRLQDAADRVLRRSFDGTPPAGTETHLECFIFVISNYITETYIGRETPILPVLYTLLQPV